MKRNTATHSSNDVETLAKDAKALLAATADVAGEKVAEARERLSSALERGKDRWARIQEQAVERARAADELIRERPYHAVAVAFAVGAVFACIVSRRR